MPKPTAIVIWFDDDTCYNVDPSRVGVVFVNEAAAKEAGHEPPYESPHAGGPIRGPIKNPPPPPSQAKGVSSTANTTTASATTAAATTESATTAAPMEGTCYYVNGMIICP